MTEGSMTGALRGGSTAVPGIEHSWNGETRLVISNDPVRSRTANRNAAIVAVCYLLLSLKLKFMTVTEERTIVCSSGKTCLC